MSGTASVSYTHLDVYKRQPDGYSIDMEGEDETINESMSQLGLMLVLAVIRCV